MADCSYICAGGGSAGGGGGCDSTACSSGQYSFSDQGWKINLTPALAGGKTPYRAFAYLPFCHGKSIGSCTSPSFTFAVTFKTDSFAGWAAYAKLLFWTDAGNILGLLPPGAPGARGNSSYRLLIFPKDDYPNKWAGEMAIADGEWYDATVLVQGTTVTVTINGRSWSSDLGVDFSKDSNGPQLGLYSFDYGGGGQRTAAQSSLFVGSVRGPGGSAAHHQCQANCLRECSGGGGPPPPPPPAPGAPVCADAGKGCNVCPACCHSFIPAGAPCELCVKESC